MKRVTYQVHVKLPMIGFKLWWDETPRTIYRLRDARKLRRQLQGNDPKRKTRIVRITTKETREVVK